MSRPVGQVHAHQQGFSFERARAKADGTLDVALWVFRAADEEGVSPTGRGAHPFGGPAGDRPAAALSARAPRQDAVPPLRGRDVCPSPIRVVRLLKT